MGRVRPAGDDEGGVEGRLLTPGVWSELLLPTRCVGCGGVGAGSEEWPVCPRCTTRVRPLPGPRCRRCHQAHDEELGPCAFCADWPELLVAARSVTPFEGPVPGMIHALKYQGWTTVASFAARRMARTVRQEWTGAPPERVVPVPTTRRRLRERGFNPAGVLAAGVAEILGIPCVEALERSREGPRQVGLPASQRAANVRGAFIPKGALSGALHRRTVLLVDDVLTTGATGVEAARAAGACGAREVVLVTFARAVPETPGSGGTPY